MPACAATFKLNFENLERHKTVREICITHEICALCQLLNIMPGKSVWICYPNNTILNSFFLVCCRLAVRKW